MAKQTFLTSEIEDDIVNWFRENEILYNIKDAEYHNKIKKDRLYQEKATELGISRKFVLFALLNS